METGLKASSPPGTCLRLAIHRHFGSKFIKRKRKKGDKYTYSGLYILNQKKKNPTNFRLWKCHLNCILI